MNARTALHLALTEARRNLWFIAIFWLLIIFVPSLEFTLIIAGLLTARITHNDHLTRATAHWKVRPASLMDWSLSRLFLLVGIFVLPVAIQQGWVLHSTGLSGSAVRWGMIESAMIMLFFVTAIFALCCVVETWTAFGIYTASFLLFFFISASLLSSWETFSREVPSANWFNGADLVANPLATWALWLLIIFAAGFLMFIVEYFRSRRLSIASSAVLCALVLLTVFWAEAHNSIYQLVPLKGSAGLTDQLESPFSPTQQQVYDDVVITGLPRGGYVEIGNLIMTNDKRRTNSLSRNPHRPETKVVNHYYAQKALVNALPDDQRVLLPNYIFDFHGEKEQNPHLPIADAIGQKNIQTVNAAGQTYQWVPIGSFPFKTGNHLLAGEFLLELRDLGSVSSGPHTRKFKFKVIGPSFLLSPHENQNRASGRSQRPGDIAIVAYHPELNESIVLSTSDNNSYGGEPRSLFGFDSRISREVIVRADPKWRLFWPEGDLAEKWLEEAHLTVYGRKYLGRFNGSVELAKN